MHAAFSFALHHVCHHRIEVELWDGSKGQGTVLTVKCSTALESAYIGCSIAINGTCLTVVRFDANSFDVNLAAETLRRTNLGSLRQDDGVNLERAMAANARNSGHMVSPQWSVTYNCTCRPCVATVAAVAYKQAVTLVFDWCGL